MTPPPRPLSLDRILEISRQDAGRRFGCRLVDLRGEDRPPLDHLPGSAWLATAQDEPHASLLPARGHRLVTLHEDPAAALRAAEALRERGWPADALATPLSKAPLVPGPPPGVPWAPDPYLAEQVERFSPEKPGRVLDLGCGSGRDSVFLAHRGFSVVGVDRLPDALDLGRRRARHPAVEVDFREAVLRTAEDLPEGPWAGSVCMRFWAPELLSALHGKMLPGGFLVLRAFGPSSPSGEGRGPRRARYRASARELEELLGDHWEFLDGPREASAERGGWVELTALRREAGLS